MISTQRQRLAREEGFTLIELLVVIIIIGILLAIAVPSYLGFREDANEAAVQANIRAAVPAAEAYYAEHGTYEGMTVAGLRADYDAGLSPDLVLSDTNGWTPSDTWYCFEATKGGVTYKYYIWADGPEHARVTPGPCL